MKEKKKIFWIIGLSLILLTICIIGIIVIKNIYMKDKYIDEDGKATTIDTPQGDVYELRYGRHADDIWQSGFETREEQ